MNDRQRDMFLWKWSRKRRPGLAGFAIRGAVIGAMGGLVFAVVMLSVMDRGGNRSTASVLAWLQEGGLMLGISIPAFALIGLVSVIRLYSWQELMYQRLLREGAHVPEQKPVLAAGDRGPMIAVAITFAVIAGFIIFLYIKLG